MKFEIRGASQATGEELLYIVEARSKQLAESKASRKGMLISSIQRASRLAKTMEEPEVVVAHQPKSAPASAPEPAGDIDFDDADYEAIEDTPSRSGRKASPGRRSSSRGGESGGGATSGGLMFKTFITPKIITVLFWVIAVLIVLGVLLGTVVTFIGAVSQSVPGAIVGALIFFVASLILGLLYIVIIRVGCEFVVIVFSIHDKLANIEDHFSNDD